ncbi:MAG: hypothetical protein FWF38_00035 [Spirochaetaceae bacterium]|nr:hypothetical protein [Spirochaetaceae bacterium]
MSENINPYQAPDADLNAPKPAVSGNGLTIDMVKYLRESAPWLRFIGILSFIGCGITVLAGVGFMIAMPLLAGLSDIYSGLLGASMGIVYIIAGVIMFFPARFTYNFGAKIRSFMQSNNAQDLEMAFKNNKSLWKFCGILCIIYLAVIPVGIVIAIISVIGTGLLGIF